MSTRIRICVNEVELLAELNDSPTARAIVKALPIESEVNRWGQEIYFPIPVHEPLEDDARVDMEVGEIAYWPPGHAFCIFFGKTPASTNDRPRAASPVNPLGRLLDSPEPLHQTRDGDPIRLEPAT